jgi:hypothetical protein
MASVVQAFQCGGTAAEAAKILETSDANHLKNYRQGRPWTAPVVTSLMYRLRHGNPGLHDRLVTEIPTNVVHRDPKTKKEQVVNTTKLFDTLAKEFAPPDAPVIDAFTTPKQEFAFYAPSPTAKQEPSKPKGRVMKIQIREAGDLLQVFRTHSGTLVLTVKSTDQPGALMSAVDQFCQGLGVTIPKVL